MIIKEPGEKLGMHIKGGLRGQRGNPLDHADEGVFISKINTGGAARRDGRLKVSKKKKNYFDLYLHKLMKINLIRWECDYWK